MIEERQAAIRASFHQLDRLSQERWVNGEEVF